MKATTKLTQLTKYVATGVAIAMLTACGGGSSSGGGEGNTTDPTPVPTATVEDNGTVIIVPNNAPLFTSATTVTVDENQNSVMTLTATDADDDVITYSIEGGVDADKVAINSSTGAMVFMENPDFEIQSSYSFQVGASDNVDTTTQDMVVTIADVFEGSAPVITTTDVSVDENQKAAFTVTATDIDGDALSYTFEGGVDDSSFDMNASTGVVTFKIAPDYERKDSYQVSVGASDGHDTTTKDITVTILDLQGGSRVLQTGQSVRYVNHDDGDYLAGMERDFDKLNSKVLKDNTTGLYWKDNSYIHVSDYTDAKNYCNSLDGIGAGGFGGYKGWRLPTIQELTTIVDRGSANDAIFGDFENTRTTKNYWSITKRADNLHYTTDFKTGDTLFSTDSTSLNVRCVRNDLFIFPIVNIFAPYSRFTRANDTISDDKTKLQWHDPIIMRWVGGHTVDIGGRSIVVGGELVTEGREASRGSFDEAIAGCEDLVADGKNDWRLANINELLSIADYSLEDGNAFYSEFKSVSTGDYLSATTSDADTDKVWTFSYDGTGWGGLAIGLAQDSRPKSSPTNYRCVRTMGD
jgi:hypothetical protein